MGNSNSQSEPSIQELQKQYLYQQEQKIKEKVKNSQNTKENYQQNQTNKFQPQNHSLQNSIQYNQYYYSPQYQQQQQQNIYYNSTQFQPQIAYQMQQLPIIKKQNSYFQQQNVMHNQPAQNILTVKTINMQEQEIVKQQINHQEIQSSSTLSSLQAQNQQELSSLSSQNSCFHLDDDNFTKKLEKRLDEVLKRSQALTDSLINQKLENL